MSQSSFLTNLQAILGLVPVITQAVVAYQAIGHSKETTVQKIGQIVEVSAAVGEVVPVPQVQAISTLIESISEQVFNPSVSSAPSSSTGTPVTLVSVPPPA